MISNRIDFLLHLLRSLECNVWNDSNAVRREITKSCDDARNGLIELAAMSDYITLSLEDSTFSFMKGYELFNTIYAQVNELYFMYLYDGQVPEQKRFLLCDNIQGSFREIQQVLKHYHSIGVISDTY